MNRYLIFSLFISAEMALEQTVKDLQAQNAQFQELILNLSKGQDELKTLLAKKKKKTRRSGGLINLGRRFRGPIKTKEQVDDYESENSEKEGGSLHDTVGDSDSEANYYHDPNEDKYKMLVDRMNAMELQKSSGLDFEDLSLISGVVIPIGFKVPAFVVYDGVSCPKLHLRSYVRRIQPHTADKKLWIHFFQESLSGAQLEWYYQLESVNIRDWNDLAEAFYRQYQYNADLAPTRMQLQSMSMGAKENFKEYAQKWRDLAGRVQPPLTDRELVDMFMSTLNSPFYSHLIGSSSSGFTELIMTGERVESGIRSGKIQVGASSSSTAKKPPSGKKESNAVYGQPGRNRSHQSVGAVHISNPTPATPELPQSNQQKPRRQFTKINMSLAQALQHMLKGELITLKDPPQNPNTSSPRYNPNARCAYHSNCPGHDTNNCWVLKNKIQDMIEAGEIEFDPPGTPNVITAPMPNHEKTVNAVDEVSYVSSVADVTTPLSIIKKKLVQAGFFPGCNEDCFYCAYKPDSCWKLKDGIQRLMDNYTILFERTPSVESMCEHLTRGKKFEDVDMVDKVPVKITSKGPVKITSKGPIKITAEGLVKTVAEVRVPPMIITTPGPIPYTSDKAIPWNYGSDVYIHGVKQEPLTDTPVTDDNLDVDNIAGSSKITRSGRIFSPPATSKNTVLPTTTSTSEPSTDARGKGPVVEPVQAEAPTAENLSKQMEEVLKIIRKSDYDIVDQLGHTPSKISMLSLLLCSEAHAKALIKFLRTAHVPNEISVDQFENCVAHLTYDNGLGFSDADLTPAKRNHNRALHISIECRGTTLSHVLIDNGSSLNVLPKEVLNKLSPEDAVLRSSNIVVRAFDGSRRVVHGEIDLPIKVGSQVFDSTFYVMDIRPAYSCLLGRPWIHGAGAVTSTLHQKLRYPVKGKIVTVYGEEEYMVSHVNTFKYVEVEGEYVETPCQTFEVVPWVVPATEAPPVVKRVPVVTRVPPTMASLKDARAVVEEGGCTIWGQLPDIPYKSDKFGLGFTAESQKAVRRARAVRITNPGNMKDQINAVGDYNEDYNLDNWIFPTVGDGLNNWKTEDVIPISFSQE